MIYTNLHELSFDVLLKLIKHYRRILKAMPPNHERFNQTVATISMLEEIIDYKVDIANSPYMYGEIMN